MYCPNCGKENQEGAGFCASCGGALNKSKKSVDLKNFDFKAFFDKYKFAIIAVVAVLVVILVVALGKDSPEKAAKRFIKAFQNCDAADVVDLMYIDEDVLEEYDMTKKEFKKELKKEIDGEECDTEDYKFKIVSTKTKGNKATVKIKATYDGDSETTELPLIKSGSKWYINFSAFEFF